MILQLTAFLPNASNTPHLLTESGIRRQSGGNLSSHIVDSVCLFVIFSQRGVFWCHFIFAWLGTSQDIQTLGYISGSAFAESLAAFLDDDVQDLGQEKQGHYR